MDTAVYIDGLNVYYGLARPLDCKWVNIQEFFERQFPQDNIQQIYFCEALVGGPTKVNQEAYFHALDSLPKVTILQGKMRRKPRDCKVNQCQHQGKRRYKDYEEKYTDVQIAVTLLADAMSGRYQKQILVTADTDLRPALEMVRNTSPNIRLALCVPALERGRFKGAEPLGRLVHRSHRASAELFTQCQFPENVPYPGGSVRRPPDWRHAPRRAAENWRMTNPDHWQKTLPAWADRP